MDADVMRLECLKLAVQANVQIGYRTPEAVVEKAKEFEMYVSGGDKANSPDTPKLRKPRPYNPELEKP